MSANQFFINLPTQTYIARFLVSRYGSPVPLTNNTFLGKELLQLLSYPYDGPQIRKRKNLSMNLYTDFVKCSVHVDFKNKIITDLSITHIFVINEFLKKQFNQQLYHFCNSYINPKAGLQGYCKAIDTFARMHNISIEEDISFEALKKSEYRYRRNNPEQKAIPQLSFFG